MNSEQVKGKLKEMAGEVQEHVGRFFGSDSQESKGHKLEMEGKAEKAMGDLKEAEEDRLERLEEREDFKPVADPLSRSASHDVPLRDPDGTLEPRVNPVPPLDRPINPLREGIDPVGNVDIELNPDGTRKY